MRTPDRRAEARSSLRRSVLTGWTRPPGAVRRTAQDRHDVEQAALLGGYLIHRSPQER
ncbi:MULTISPECIES: hypothetical protein [Miniimonas]|uniref:hypothetical protein n=1 Tax=Miniimonas TaxID=947525 RepID=UPI00131F28FB|nr:MULTISPECIES: hypothetical protein [Miniimonas]